MSMNLEFRKSSYSASQTACVEVADWPTGAVVRDTQNRELGALIYNQAEWNAFLHTAKSNLR
ncbi:DUF397 domain-containing protein [Nocardiopsis sp. JB363]|uniref:DUF397 domain-containing protein n=1 Tax=Nocardiopsis sp. JB363 TaxID=1434837 RepID=UPI00097B2484|nr:DUF397 domain-containing protein [Nocardiopsis sp. JB363]SIO87671.1 protein of unknown function DUF397 [Nocardiopsis sp. JB363]